MPSKTFAVAITGAVLMFGTMLVRAQEGKQPSQIIISIPTCNDAHFALNNPNCSPEQRSRAAVTKREQEAAEKLRKAEQARKDAAVATEVQRLGVHRSGEARRLVEMREAAAAARGTPITPAASANPPKQCEKVPSKGTINSMPEGSSLLFTGFKTRPEAEASTRRKMERGCLAATGTAGGALSNMNCAQEGGRWSCNAAYTCTGMATRNCPSSQ